MFIGHCLNVCRYRGTFSNILSLTLIIFFSCFQLLKGRHMMVRVGGGWDTLEHFLSRHEPCQVRLVTPGRRDVLPVPAAPAPPTPPADDARSAAGSRASLKEPSGTVSPVDSKASSLSGKISPIELKSGRTTRASSKASSGKSSPLQDTRRTSTPKPASARSLKSALTLPLKPDSVDGRQQNSAPRTRKQSAPSSFSTPNTPTGRSVRTPPTEYRKSLTSTALLNAPKKSRSMSLAVAPKDEKKPFCGTDRLNQAAKKKSSSAVSTPTETLTSLARKTRSQSLASTPTNEPKKTFSVTNGYAKKTRSMSLAAAVESPRPLLKSTSAGGGLTQAAIEESIRLSLAASIADDACPKKPFLHIKAKYRSPPPREVPPR